MIGIIKQKDKSDQELEIITIKHAIDEENIDSLSDNEQFMNNLI